MKLDSPDSLSLCLFAQSCRWCMSRLGLSFWPLVLWYILLKKIWIMKQAIPSLPSLSPSLSKGYWLVHITPPTQWQESVKCWKEVGAVWLLSLSICCATIPTTVNHMQLICSIPPGAHPYPQHTVTQTNAHTPCDLVCLFILLTVFLI